PGMEAGVVQWPAAEPSHGPGKADGVLMHGGTIRGLMPLTFAGAPGAGDLVVTATVGYQLCDDAGRLLPPSSVNVRVGVKELAMVDRALPPPEGA
ncbi:MAG TPA: hypothetical protein VEL48_09185, partial [Candidatus Acidoferrales bacterium]|nr:hypothetical protein [Candidatus Acidoferrales bacterium]